MHSYAEVENRSDEVVRDARLVLAATPPIELPLRTLAPGAHVRERLPDGIGESTLRFAARAGGRDVAVDCGYVESDGLYRARIAIEPDLTAHCTVDLD